MADHTPTPALDPQTDAKSRAVRTFIQGLGVDVLVAIAVVVLLWLPNADLASRTAWITVALSVAKSVLTAVFSYVMRLKVTPPAPVTPDDQAK